MKKIISMSLVLIIAICIMGNVYAALSCNVSLQANKTKLSKNEEFIVDVKVSNIQSDRGIIALEATLEYDKNSLELVKMEGKNGWETPTDGTTYNSANGKIAIDRDSLGKNNETVFTITFKVKNTSKQNLEVNLKDIIVADGTKPTEITKASQNITVSEGTTNTDEQQPKPDNKPDTNPGNNTVDENTSNTVTDDTNSNTTDNVNSNITDNVNSNTTGNVNSNTTNNVNSSTVNNKVSNTTEKETIPYVGDKNIVLAILIGLLIIIAIILFIRMMPSKRKR